MNAKVKVNVIDKEHVVTKVIKVPVVDSVTLTMSVEQAIAVAVVLHRIGGHPDKSARGYFEGVNNVLRDALFYTMEMKNHITEHGRPVRDTFDYFNELVDRRWSSLYFNDYEILPHPYLK